MSDSINKKGSNKKTSVCPVTRIDKQIGRNASKDEIRDTFTILNLSGEDLHDSHFEGANLSKADIMYANLKGAHLQNADLKGADLSCSDLENADIRNADMRYTDLCGANLSNTVVGNTNFRKAVFNKNTKLPFSIKVAEQQGMIEI